MKKTVYHNNNQFLFKHTASLTVTSRAVLHFWVLSYIREIKNEPHHLFTYTLIQSPLKILEKQGRIF